MNVPRGIDRIFSIVCLCAATFFGLISPVKALIIVPTFDSSISGNPTSGPAMEAAINAAIQVFETNIADNFTVNITFMVNTNVGLSESESYYVTVSYSAYRRALETNAQSAYDKLALSQLPNTSTDPVIGNNLIEITVPLATHLGLTTESTPTPPMIFFNTNIMSFTRPPPNNSHLFDMQSAIEHEIDEVLGGGGSGCNLGFVPYVGATDLFRYATNGINALLARSWTTNNGDNAFFSVDGTNVWFRFNTDSDGDLGDFWGVAFDTNTFLPVYWSPVGVFPHAEVQDAFATPGFFAYSNNFVGYPTTNSYYENTSPDLGTNELTMMDVIGWTLIPHLPPPVLAVAFSGANKETVSWSANYTGFSLQERTNLNSGSWIASASGTNNPAVITNSLSHKYYRLYEAAVPGAEPAVMVAQPTGTNAPILRRLKGLQRSFF
jgi:hypothetical protein